MKALEPQNADWYRTAPVKIVATRDIAASPDVVFAALADHESWPEWFTVLKKVEVLGPAEGVGARRRVVLPGMTIDEEFVAWEPGVKFGFTVTHMTRAIMSSLTENVDLEDLGQGRTRITYTQAFAPTGVGKVLMPVVKGQFRKGLAAGLDGLAARLGA